MREQAVSGCWWRTRVRDRDVHALADPAGRRLVGHRQRRVVGGGGASRLLPYLALSAAAEILADRIRRTTVLRLSAWSGAVLLVGSALGLAAGQLGVAVVLAVLTGCQRDARLPAVVAAMPRLAGGASDLLTRLLVRPRAALLLAVVPLGVAGGAEPPLSRVRAHRSRTEWAKTCLPGADGVPAPAAGYTGWSG